MKCLFLHPVFTERDICDFTFSTSGGREFLRESPRFKHAHFKKVTSLTKTPVLENIPSCLLKVTINYFFVCHLFIVV